MTEKEYLLVCLMENLGEVQREIGRCLKFTPEDVYPFKKESNFKYAEGEMNKLTAVLELLKEQGLTFYRDDKIIAHKKSSIKSYMIRSKDLGVLENVSID